MSQTVIAVNGHDKDAASETDVASRERAINVLLFEIQVVSQNLQTARMLKRDSDVITVLEQRLDDLQSRFEQLIRLIPPLT